MNKKVSKIEFHICYSEMDDCIVRMADLIKEGYTVETIANEPLSTSSIFLKYQEPSIHIVLQRGDLR